VHLVSNIVMILENVFAYISSETWSIWTYLGTSVV